MPTIEILGVKHTYELSPPTSSKPTLVFLHGWLLSRRYWQPLIERLSPHYQCLCYDLRGFGDSQPDRDRPPHSHCRYTPAAYASDLAVLLEGLDIDRAWLVGHSLGGTIALWGAHQLDGRFEGVVCVNAGGGIYLKEEFEKFRAAGTQIVKLRPRWLCRLPLLELLFVRASVARPIERHWARQRLVDFVTAHPQAALRALLDSTTETEVHQLPQIVSRLQQPVYFVAGANDSIMDPKYVRHLASFHHLFQHGGENVIEIPECGHLAMVEQPDILADRLRAILRDCYESSRVG
ncbi:alpha/beta hydrolase [Oscillatoriales cyanobacterium LEGE 11467]|uniref:Alpha/beta hydrolase n=1 Tax=Zarconia navalis LEGE 11467 TaxID=1828826 RepID=A0A928Z9G0_9CYAN|nr:alpha/beta hydrolase [Zarconia navalis]MBE9041648.1 alpha/beta hydrolase [Zarconia navalis LEGE 11467]